MSDDTIPDRTAARAALLAELDRLSDHGNPPPCWTVALPERGCFTSDDDSEQALAARMCRPCPARAECRAYGDAFPLRIRAQTCGQPRRAEGSAKGP